MAIRYFGCHVSVAGGLANAVAHAARLGVNTIQIHPSPPQRWNLSPFDSAAADAFNEARRAARIKRVFLHGVYLINLASDDRDKVQRAVTSLAHYLDLAERIAADGVIFHVGSNRDQQDDSAGLAQAAAMINRVLTKAPGKSRLLLEVAAGSGRVIGDRFEELREIYDRLEDKRRAGFALDTQHLWASGYDLAAQLDEVVAEADRVLGLKRVRAIHVNDSKSRFNSRSDRHADLGQGTIGDAALRAVVCHPGLQRIPMILETPGLKDPETAKAEVERLRQWIVGGQTVSDS